MTMCYCGSKHPYSICCHPYHQGLVTPPTPEALMRSRYAAYCVANIDYIQATMCGKASQKFDPISARRWAEQVIWIGLQIVHTSQPSPTHGTVEFIASFVDGKILQHMREISEFAYIEGRWFYVDGQHPTQSSSQKELSRNSPCPCGSKKKWKHCHGKAV